MSGPAQKADVRTRHRSGPPWVPNRTSRRDEFVAQCRDRTQRRQLAQVRNGNPLPLVTQDLGGLGRLGGRDPIWVPVTGSPPGRPDIMTTRSIPICRQSKRLAHDFVMAFAPFTRRKLVTGSNSRR